MTVGGVDDQHVGAQLEDLGDLALDVAVDTHGDTHHEATAVVDGGPVERGAQRALARDGADEQAVGHHRREAQALLGETIEDGLERRVRFHADHVASHDVTHLGEAVVAGGIALGEDAGGRAVGVDDHGRPVGALVQEEERVLHGVGGSDRHRRVVDEVAALHVLDVVAHDLERDVLGEHGETATAGRRLGHAPARDRGHVRHDDRDRRPDAVGRREIDVEPRAHLVQAGHHEDVAVGEVVRGLGVVIEAHGCERLRAQEAPRSNRPHFPSEGEWCGCLSPSEGGKALQRMRSRTTGRGSGGSGPIVNESSSAASAGAKRSASSAYSTSSS